MARCAACPPRGIFVTHSPFISAPTESAPKSGRPAWGRRKLKQIRCLRALLSGAQGAPAKVQLRECSHRAQKPRTGQLPKSGRLGGDGGKGLTAREGPGQRQVPRGSRWGQESNRLDALGQERSGAGLRPGPAPVRTCPRMLRGLWLPPRTSQTAEPTPPGPPSSSPLCAGHQPAPVRSPSCTPGGGQAPSDTQERHRSCCLRTSSPVTTGNHAPDLRRGQVTREKPLEALRMEPSFAWGMGQRTRGWKWRLVRGDPRGRGDGDVAGWRWQR